MRPGWPRASRPTSSSSRRLLDLTDNLVSGTDGRAPAARGAPRRGRHLPRRRRRQGHGDVLRHRQRRGPVDYGFWLDDAFASGGSAGYDHKAMGITARGAWESVKRHFREMGVDTQTEDFTVVGVGDMSGDVFGNGMLLSEHIRLVAAFDHRHIFLDPDPDAGDVLRRASPAVRPAPLVLGRLRHAPDQRGRRRLPPLGQVGADQPRRWREALGLRPRAPRADPGRADEGDPASPRSTCCGTAASAPTSRPRPRRTPRSATGPTTRSGSTANALRCKVVGEGGNLGCQPARPDRGRPGRRAGQHRRDRQLRRCRHLRPRGQHQDPAHGDDPRGRPDAEAAQRAARVDDRRRGPPGAARQLRAERPARQRPAPRSTRCCRCTRG